MGGSCFLFGKIHVLLCLQLQIVKAIELTFLERKDVMGGSNTKATTASSATEAATGKQRIKKTPQIKQECITVLNLMYVMYNFNGYLHCIFLCVNVIII